MRGITGGQGAKSREGKEAGGGKEGGGEEGGRKEVSKGEGISSFSIEKLPSVCWWDA